MNVNAIIIIGTHTKAFLLILCVVPPTPKEYNAGNIVGTIYLACIPATVLEPTAVKLMYKAVVESIIATAQPISPAPLTI